MFKIKIDRSHLVIFVFSFFYQGIYLLNDGVFWDDWVLFNMSDAGIKYMYDDNGGGAAGYLYHQFINRFSNPVLASHVIGYIASVAVSIILFNVLNTLNTFSRNQALIIVMIYMALPINIAGYTMIGGLAKLYFGLFFIGFYFFLKIGSKGGLLYRFFALSFFTLSFVVPSVISFYLGVMSVYFVRSNFPAFSIKKLFLFSLRKLDFITLPLISWHLFKIIFAVPTNGIHAATGYNAIHIRNVLHLPISFKHSFFDLFKYSFLETIDLYGLFGSLCFIIFLFIIIINVRINARSETKSVKFYLWLLISGIVLFYAGSFSYVLVGKMPVMEYKNSGFNSRHQLLLGLGLSFIIFSIIEMLHLFSKTKLKVKYIYVVLFFMFFSSGVYSLMQFKRDWIKQQVIIRFFKTNEIIKANRAFIISDETIEYNAFGRKVAFYEYTGMLKYALGEETRFAISQVNIDVVQKWYKRGVREFDGIEGFSLGNFKFDHFDYSILIKKGDRNLDNFEVIRSMYSKDWIRKEGAELFVFQLRKINGTI